MIIRVFLGACLFAGLASVGVEAHQSDTVIRAGTDEVLLDVVARDKKGQTVRNLEPADLELYDKRSQAQDYFNARGGGSGGAGLRSERSKPWRPAARSSSNRSIRCVRSGW